MKIGTPKEMFEGEARVAMTPDSAAQLQKLGHECVIETGAGMLAGFSDADYKAAGVEVVKTAAALWKAADVVAKVRPPDDAEIKRLREGQTLISFFNPGGNEKQMDRPPRKAPPSSRWTWCRASAARRRWMRSLDGQYRGLPRGDRGGQQLWPLLHRSDHGRGQGAAGQGSGRRRGRCRSCRDRHLDHRSARSPTPSTCAPKWPSRSNRWAPSSSSSISRKSSRTARRPAAMPLSPRPSSAKRSWPSSASWRPRSTSSSPPR